MLNNIKDLIFTLSVRERYFLILIVLLSILSFILEIIGISLILPILSHFSDITSNDLQSKFLSKILLAYELIFKNNISNLLLFLILIFFLKALFLNVFYFIQLMFLRSFVLRLYERAYLKILNNDLLNNNKINSSNFIRDNIQTVNTIGAALSSFINLSSDFILLVGLSIFLFMTNFTISFVSISILIFFSFLFIFFLRPKIEKYGKLNQNITSSIIENIKNLFGFSSEIKIYNLEDNLFKTFMKFQSSKSFIDVKTSFMQFIPRNLFELISIIILFVIANITLNFLNLSESELLTLISIFSLSFIKLIPVYNRALVCIQQINLSKEPIKNISYLIKNNFNKKNKSSKVELNKFIELKKIKFSYDKNFLFNNYSKKFFVGKIYGIKGSTGSGKTTFVNIIAGLIKLKSGRILVDGKYNIINNKNWYKLLGYSKQTPFIANDTIINNIVFENSLSKLLDIEKKKLFKILNNLSLNEKINKLPKKLNSIINENSTNISGGEKQRISMARALYKEPRVLILDESTSSVDKRVEKKILKYLKSIKNDKIIFIISHQDSSLEICDEIISL